MKRTQEWRSCDRTQIRPAKTPLLEGLRRESGRRAKARYLAPGLHENRSCQITDTLNARLNCTKSGTAKGQPTPCGIKGIVRTQRMTSPAVTGRRQGSANTPDLPRTDGREVVTMAENSPGKLKGKCVWQAVYLCNFLKEPLTGNPRSREGTSRNRGVHYKSFQSHRKFSRIPAQKRNNHAAQALRPRGVIFHLGQGPF